MNIKLIKVKSNIKKKLDNHASDIHHPKRITVILWANALIDCKDLSFVLV